jgi:hypothetical protein
MAAYSLWQKEAMDRQNRPIRHSSLMTKHQECLKINCPGTEHVLRISTGNKFLRYMASPFLQVNIRLVLQPLSFLSLQNSPFITILPLLYKSDRGRM